MVVPSELAAVSKTADSIRQRGVTREDGTAVAERSKVFRRVEAERAGYPDSPHRTAPRCCEVRLTAIFDDRQAVTGSDAFDAGHVSRLPIEMYRHDGARPRSHEPFDLYRIDSESDGIDVGEHRPGADHGDRERGECGRQLRRDDLVAGPDAEGPQRKRDGVRTGADANSMGRAGRRCELVFKCFDFGTQHEPAALD